MDDERLLPQLGETFCGYVISERLADTGLGRVFRAHADGREKRLTLFPNPDAGLVAAWEALYATLGHTRTAGIDAEEAFLAIPPVPFFVGVPLDGETLLQRLARRGPLRAAEAARILRRLADAALLLHAAGLSLGRVPPERLFLTRELANLPGVDVRVVDLWTNVEAGGDLDADAPLLAHLYDQLTDGARPPWTGVPSLSFLHAACTKIETALYADTSEVRISAAEAQAHGLPPIGVAFDRPNALRLERFPDARTLFVLTGDAESLLAGNGDTLLIRVAPSEDPLTQADAAIAAVDARRPMVVDAPARPARFAGLAAHAVGYHAGGVSSVAYFLPNGLVALLWPLVYLSDRPNTIPTPGLLTPTVASLRFV